VFKGFFFDFLKPCGDIGYRLAVPRKVLYEEFGNKKRYYRPDYHYAVITACNLNGIPFMPWEYVHPPNTDDKGQEFDDHQATYPVLVYGVLVANKTGSVQRWSNLEICNVS